MSDNPKNLFKSNNKSVLEEVRQVTENRSQSKNKPRTIFQENALLDVHRNKRNSLKNENNNTSAFDVAMSIPKSKPKGKRQISKRRDLSFGDIEESDENLTSSYSVINHLTKFRKEIPRPRSNRNKRPRSKDSSETNATNGKDSDTDSTLTDIDVSSTEVADGLSTGSILELYDTTIRSDNTKLKRLQIEIKRNYINCFVRLELVTIATLCSTNAKHLLKPGPKVFMVNNEPCYEELKSVLKNMKSLKSFMGSKNTSLMENRMLLDVLHWIFFDSKLPVFIEIKFNQTQNDLQRIDTLRLNLKPALITKVKYAQYSNQEVDYRYFLRYLRQNREDFDIKLGYVAVHMQLLYQVLADGIDVLIQDKKGVAIYTNLITSVDSIRDNVYYIMNSNYNYGSNIVFEYFAILVTELVIQKDSHSDKNDFSIYRNTINMNDCIYYIKNVKRIKIKLIFFFKMGSTKMFKRLLSIDKKMYSKFMLDKQFTQDQSQNLSQIGSEKQRVQIVLSVGVYVLGILMSIVCFVWYMKTWRYF